MAINKVVYGNDTLIDLTNDTVEPNNLLEGETAHDRSGSPVTGTAKQGHIVQNSSGTDMTQRGSVQFTDAHLTDDSQNDKTKVEVVKSVASADYPSETEDGLYLKPDGDGSVIEPASEDYVEVTADGNTTWADLLKSVFNDAKFDISKVNKYSKLAYSTNGIKIYDLNLYFVNGTTSLAFSSSSDSSYDYAEFNGSFGYFKTGGTDVSSNKPTQGATLTLYYGNKKAVVDLQTTANRCVTSDDKTVQQIFDDMKFTAVSGVTSGTKTSDANALKSSIGGRTLFRGSFKVTTACSSGDAVVTNLGVQGGGVGMCACPYSSGGILTYQNGTLLTNSSLAVSSNAYYFMILV